MRLAIPLLTLLMAAAITGCSSSRDTGLMQVDTAQIAGFMEGYVPTNDSLRFTGEKHLRNIRQLTFGGNNAEAYWSFDSKQLIFQSDWGQINSQGCDQQFVMNANGTPLRDGSLYDMVSTGQGRTTCGYFLKDGRMIYGSTHEGARECPTTAAERTGRYVWDVFATYDIYVTDGDESKLLIGGPGYDAEPTVSPDGRFIVFTSTRSGDLELYRFEVSTGEILQLTNTLGYDGGAFFSPDGSKIIWRASRPTGAEADRYRMLLTQNAVEPGAMNLFVANADGTDARQMTDLPGANWAPFFHPFGEKILFSTNHHTMDSGGREFDLFTINLDGTGLERITFSGTFDAFPMFSPDGRKLVFASNRRGDRTDSRDTNIFVADWVEQPSDLDTGFVGRGSSE